MILLERHDAVEIRADSNALEELLPELKKQRPNYITLLIKPEDLDFNLVQQVLSGRFEIATEPSGGDNDSKIIRHSTTSK